MVSGTKHEGDSISDLRRASAQRSTWISVKSSSADACSCVSVTYEHIPSLYNHSVVLTAKSGGRTTMRCPVLTVMTGLTTGTIRKCTPPVSYTHLTLPTICSV
eukprot:2409698-Rhodomonas_salina.3